MTTFATPLRGDVWRSDNRTLDKKDALAIVVTSNAYNDENWVVLVDRCVGFSNVRRHAAPLL